VSCSNDRATIGSYTILLLQSSSSNISSHSWPNQSSDTRAEIWPNGVLWGEGTRWSCLQTIGKIFAFKSFVWWYMECTENKFRDINTVKTLKKVFSNSRFVRKSQCSPEILGCHWLSPGISVTTVQREAYLWAVNEQSWKLAPPTSLRHPQVRNSA